MEIYQVRSDGEDRLYAATSPEGAIEADRRAYVEEEGGHEGDYNFEQVLYVGRLENPGHLDASAKLAQIAEALQAEIPPTSPEKGLEFVIAQLEKVYELATGIPYEAGGLLRGEVER